MWHDCPRNSHPPITPIRIPGRKPKGQARKKKKKDKIDETLQKSHAENQNRTYMYVQNSESLSSSGLGKKF